LTVWRYIREAVDLLAEAAPTLTQAMRRIGGLAYEVLLRRQGGYRAPAARSVCRSTAGACRPACVRVSSAHANVRAIGERAIAMLKTWKVLVKLRCCPQRAISVLAAILLLQLIEEQRESDEIS
jgi:hypothetical protein